MEKETGLVGRALDEIMNDAAKTPQELADILSVSYTQLMNWRYGLRHPNSELIYKLASGLKMSPGKVGSYFIMKNLESNDKPGVRRVPVMVFNFSRGKKAGTLDAIDEAKLKEMYPDYTPQDFDTYAARYLGDKYYNAGYEKYIEKLGKDKQIKSLVGEETTTNIVLKEIVSKLLGLDDVTLNFINDSIDVILKHRSK